MDFYIPAYTSDEKGSTVEQQILTQVLLPQISNKSADGYLYANIKQQQIKNLKKFPKSNLISLHPSFGCDFESYAKNAKTEMRKEHVQIMEKIKTEKLSALTPYAQFYLVDRSSGNKIQDLKKNAIPIIFNKSFDIEYFIKNRGKTASRGEGAGIKSITVNRQYDITGDFDPITLNAQFFFSSYDVFIRKPAVDKGRLYGVSYKSNLSGPFVGTNFFERAKFVTYKELIRRPPKKDDEDSQVKGFNLLLEYGWTFSEGVSPLILTPKEREVINKFEKSYFVLNALQHSINFNADGSFTLNVEYIPKQLVDSNDSQNFKTGILTLPSFIDANAKDEKRKSRIKQLQKDIKQYQEFIKQKATKNLKDKTVKLNKEEITEAKRLLKKYKTDLKKLQGNTKFSEYARDIITLARKRNLTNKFTYEIKKFSVDGEGPRKIQYKVKNEIKLPDITPLNGITEKSFTVKVDDFRDKLLKYFETLRKNEPPAAPGDSYSDKIIEAFNLVGPGGTDLEKDAANKIIEEVFNLSYAETKSGPVTIEFIFVRDIINLVSYIAERSLDNPKPPPTIILGNIPFPLPSGDKFWCNIGDIPLTVDVAKVLFREFFKIYPEANPTQFFQFLFNKFFKNYLIDSSQQKSALPTIARSFINFSNSEFFKDNSTRGFRPQIDLLVGERKYFDEFCSKYFNDADIKSAEGCIFYGQAFNLFYENSKLFMSERLNAFRENFFKDDNKLQEFGIGKLVLGSADGLLQNITFNASSDEFLTNLSYELNVLKPEVASDIISTNYQYNINATLFGNKIYDFSNLVYVPSYTLGKTTPISLPEDLVNKSQEEINKLKKEAATNDFEIGGLYTILQVTDNLQLDAGQYTKSLNASCILRDSAILVRELAKYDKSIRKSVLNPSTNLSVSIINYVGINAEAMLKRKEGPINKIISKKDKAQEEDLIADLDNIEIEANADVEEITVIDNPSPLANAEKVVNQGGVNQ